MACSRCRGATCSSALLALHLFAVAWTVATAQSPDAQTVCATAVQQFLAADAGCPAPSQITSPTQLCKSCNSTELSNLLPKLRLFVDTGSSVNPSLLQDQIAEYALVAPIGSWPIEVVNANDTIPYYHKYNYTHRPRTLPKADVYIIAAEMLGNMIGSFNNSQLAPITSRMLFNVSPDQVNLNWYGLDATLRLQVALYGIDMAGVPMSGSSAGQVFYRSDVFEQLGIGPESLSTWGSLLDVLANVTGKDWDGDGEPEHGFCWQLSGLCGATNLLTIMSPIMQTLGPSQGVYIDLRTGNLLVDTAGMYLAMAIFQRLAQFAQTTPELNGVCGTVQTLFLKGKCLISLSTPGDAFKLFSQLNETRVRGRFRVAMSPGSDIIYDHVSRKLVPCNDTTCPYAKLEGTVGQQFTATAVFNSTQPRNYSALLPNLSAAMRAQLVLGGPLLNYAPSLSGVALNVIDGTSPKIVRTQAMQLISYLTSSATSWDMLLKVNSGVTPYRYEHWSIGIEGSVPQHWLDAGYDNMSLPSYLESIRHTVDWGANAVPPPQFPGALQLAVNVQRATEYLVNGSSPEQVAIDLNVTMYNAILDVYGTWSAFMAEYRASVSYQDFPRQDPSPAPTPSPPSVATSTIETVVIVSCVVLSVMMGVITWLLLMRNARKHLDLLGRVRPPPASPDTVLLVAHVKNLEPDWISEQCPADALARTQEIWDALVQQLLRKHGGYQVPTSSTGCLHAAFYTPGEAATFALLLQRTLMTVKWPKQLLELPQFAPVYMEPTLDHSNSVHGAKSSDLSPASPAVHGMSPGLSDRGAFTPVSPNPMSKAVLDVPAAQSMPEALGGGASAHDRNSNPQTAAKDVAGASACSRPRMLASQCQTFGHQCAASWQRVVPGVGAGCVGGAGAGAAADETLFVMVPLSPSLPKHAAGAAPGGGMCEASTPLVQHKSGVPQSHAGRPFLWFSAKAADGGGGLAVSAMSVSAQQVLSNPQAVLVSRGLQVCVGLCAVCASEVRRTKDPVSGRVAFSGQAMEIAIHMAAAGQAGMILVPQQTFRQLPIEIMSHDTLFCHYGEYQFYPTLPPLDVYLALDKTLLGRLALFRPLDLAPSGVALSPGVLAAPVGRAAMVFTHIVGVQTLLAWNYAITSQALEVFTRLAQQELKVHNGYLVEHVSGFMLSAFQEPGAAMLWALQLQELMLLEPWSEELLSHEMCEEVIVACGEANAQLGPQALRLPTSTHRRSARCSSELTGGGGATLLYRGPRLKTGIDVGPILTALNTVTGRMAYRGKVMNRAARVASIASSGQVLCSAEALNAAHGVAGINALHMHILEAQLLQEQQQQQQEAELQAATAVSMGDMRSPGTAARSAIALATAHAPTSLGQVTMGRHSHGSSMHSTLVVAPTAFGACGSAAGAQAQLEAVRAANARASPALSLAAPMLMAGTCSAGGYHSSRVNGAVEPPQTGAAGLYDVPTRPSLRGIGSATLHSSGRSSFRRGNTPFSLATLMVDPNPNKPTPTSVSAAPEAWQVPSVAPDVSSNGFAFGGGGVLGGGSAGGAGGAKAEAAQPALAVQAESLGLFQLKGIVERIEVIHCFYVRPNSVNVMFRRPSMRMSSSAFKHVGSLDASAPPPPPPPALSPDAHFHGQHSTSSLCPLGDGHHPSAPLHASPLWRRSDELPYAYAYQSLGGQPSQQLCNVHHSTSAGLPYSLPGSVGSAGPSAAGGGRTARRTRAARRASWAPGMVDDSEVVQALTWHLRGVGHAGVTLLSPGLPHNPAVPARCQDGRNSDGARTALSSGKIRKGSGEVFARVSEAVLSPLGGLMMRTSLMLSKQQPVAEVATPTSRPQQQQQQALSGATEPAGRLAGRLSGGALVKGAQAEVGAAAAAAGMTTTSAPQPEEQVLSSALAAPGGPAMGAAPKVPSTACETAAVATGLVPTDAGTVAQWAQRTSTSHEAELDPGAAAARDVHEGDEPWTRVGGGSPEQAYLARRPWCLADITEDMMEGSPQSHNSSLHATPVISSRGQLASHPTAVGTLAAAAARDSGGGAAGGLAKPSGASRMSSSTLARPWLLQALDTSATPGGGTSDAGTLGTHSGEAAVRDASSSHAHVTALALVEPKAALTEASPGHCCSVLGKANPGPPQPQEPRTVPVPTLGWASPES